MKNISIVIPLRVDSQEREANLRCVLQYLSNFDFVDIDILEADTKRRFFYPANNQIRYRFIYDEEAVFYRTKYLNQLLKKASHSIVGVWDTDVIIPEKQLLQAIEYICNGYIMSFPYDGDFRFLTPAESEKVRKNIVNLDMEQGYRLLGRPSVGGAFLVNRDLYISVGGENESFYGWGPEDVERVKRLEILELTIARVRGSLYHLYHKRFPDVGVDNEKKRQHNQKVLFQTCRMNKQELKNYINLYMIK